MTFEYILQTEDDTGRTVNISFGIGTIGDAPIVGDYITWDYMCSRINERTINYDTKIIQLVADRV